MNINKIAFIGTGAWASALANVVSHNQYETIMYGIEEEVVNEINTKHTNGKYLKDISLDEKIKATLDLKEAILGANIIVIAVPSFAIEQIMDEIKNLITKETIIVNVAKGFEKNSKKTMIEYISSIMNNHQVKGLVSLIGPSFAKEVADKEMTAIVAVSKNEAVSKIVQQVFSNNWFRVYTNTDEIGCSYCSSLKNVIALASGILEGLNKKNNPRAALISRGLKEITRFVVKMGGEAETCLGLTGVGDLVLTCTSTTSRNFSAGVLIGKYGIDEFNRINTKTVEGIYACEIAKKIADENEIYAPIINAVYNVLFNKIPANEELYRLMNNELKKENI